VSIEVLVDFSLYEKISTVTVDNRTSNDITVKALLEKLDYDMLILDGKFLYMRCCAHIVNLSVKDGLDVLANIEKFQDALRYQDW